MTDEPSIVEYSQMPVRITRDSVYIGSHKMPGCIIEDGITLKPSGGTDFNRLTITFVVGRVTVEDPWVTAEQVTTPAQTSTQFHSKAPPETTARERIAEQAWTRRTKETR